MRVRFSRPAEADLEAIGDYIALDDPAAAAALVFRLRDTSLSLHESPRRYPEIDHHGRDEIRKVSRGHYIIFYRIKPGEVEIIRIVHGATDWAQLFA